MILFPTLVLQAPPIAPSPVTQVVMLGTGTPHPNPQRQGPAVAIVVNGQPYLVDCGAGVVRQASAATEKGIKGLEMEKLTRLFVTHLHSDHTLGLPDLMFTPSVMARTEPLLVFGPKGTARMVGLIRDAWSEDREIRINGGEGAKESEYRIETKDIEPGLVYEDKNVKVRAFKVDHGKWPHAFGFRFETPDRTIVVSGDTTYSKSLIQAARGCDILIHEVYSEAGLKLRTKRWQDYHSTYHTSGPDLGRIAQVLKPKLLVLYHQLPFRQPADQILKEVRSVYDGPVVAANDLDVY